ncbi:MULTISPECIES: TolB family protein [Micromonospora]|nr:PD40 domain-containing protein [Micromonospora yangpuensis]
MSRARLAGATAVGVLTALVPVTAAQAAADTTTVRVSVATDGTQADSDSYRPSISGDGRYVAFSSAAQNLVPGDTNYSRDVFLHDTVTGSTELVSVGPAGVPVYGSSELPRISRDGRFVAFNSSAQLAGDPGTIFSGHVFVWERETKQLTRISQASHSWDSLDISGDGRYVTFSAVANLVPQDTNFDTDVYVHDRDTGTTTLVSRTPDGTAPFLGASTNPSISDDGRYISYQSRATDLVEQPVSDGNNVYLFDRQRGTTQLVSAPPSGPPAPAAHATSSEISSDGRYVTFTSDATNLVPGDTNDTTDVFLWERATGTLVAASATPAGVPGNGTALSPRLSADGRYVTFWSNAKNLTGQPVPWQNQVFRFDRVSRTNVLVAVPAHGTDGGGEHPDISADGRYVAYVSAGTSLVPGDTNNRYDIFRTEITGPPTRWPLPRPRPGS